MPDVTQRCGFSVLACISRAERRGCYGPYLLPCLACDVFFGAVLLIVTVRYENERSMKRFQNGSAMADLKKWKSTVRISADELPEVRAALDRAISEQSASHSLYLSSGVSLALSAVLSIVLTLMDPYLESMGLEPSILVMTVLLFLLFFFVLSVFALRVLLFKIWHKCPKSSLKLLSDALASNAIYGDRSPSDSGEMVSGC